MCWRERHDAGMCFSRLIFSANKKRNVKEFKKSMSVCWVDVKWKQWEWKKIPWLLRLAFVAVHTSHLFCSRLNLLSSVVNCGSSWLWDSFHFYSGRENVEWSSRNVGLRKRQPHTDSCVKHKDRNWCQTKDLNMKDACHSAPCELLGKEAQWLKPCGTSAASGLISTLFVCCSFGQPGLREDVRVVQCSSSGQSDRLRAKPGQWWRTESSSQILSGGCTTTHMHTQLHSNVYIMIEIPAVKITGWRNRWCSVRWNG